MNKPGKYDAYILAHYKDESAQEMADALGCGRSAIVHVCNKLGLTPKPHGERKYFIKPDEVKETALTDQEKFLKHFEGKPDLFEAVLCDIYFADVNINEKKAMFLKTGLIDDLPRDKTGKLIRPKAEYDQGGSYLTTMQKYSNKK